MFMEYTLHNFRSFIFVIFNVFIDKLLNFYLTLKTFVQLLHEAMTDLFVEGGGVTGGLQHAPSPTEFKVIFK